MLGTLFGPCGFHWLCNSKFNNDEFPNLGVFSLQTVPWLCKATK